VGSGDPLRQIRTPPDRYEPLPGLGGLPAWVWARMGRRSRIGLALVLLGLAAVAVPLVLSIQESKRERTESERAARERAQERQLRALQAEQRPRFGGSAALAPPAAGALARLEGRERMLDELVTAILADARGRVRSGALDGPIRRVECQPFPRTVRDVGTHEDLSRVAGRYSCVAVTSEFGRSAGGVAGVIGHPYRARADFESGRFAYCKVSGRPEPVPDPRVTTPRVCGGF
jgi:hypothetical protein